jgi:hypothetical protein
MVEELSKLSFEEFELLQAMRLKANMATNMFFFMIKGVFAVQR